MKNHVSRRNFIKKSVLFTGAAATLPLLPSFAADTNAPDPNALAAGAAPAAEPVAAPAIIYPPAPTPILAPPGFGVAAGPFQPTWESLAAVIRCRTGFATRSLASGRTGGRNASRRWAIGMRKKCISSTSADYKFQCENYGHPSKMGFKDVIHRWKAEEWDPRTSDPTLQDARAQNISRPWRITTTTSIISTRRISRGTSVAIGPKKDIVGGWAKAARAAGLRLSLTSHGDRAWSWYQAAQRSDPSGPLAGVPYDG